MRIEGLVNVPEFNGRTGKVTSFDVRKGRWLVELHGDETRIVSFKPTNLVPMQGPLMSEVVD